MISRKMILVVEDNALNRALLCQILAAEYDVLEAENGQAALDLLKQYGEGVSLILLDIVMPVMDGYTFLSVVKDGSFLFLHPGYRDHAERQRIRRGVPLCPTVRRILWQSPINPRLFCIG